jgi:hypothetical protein
MSDEVRRTTQETLIERQPLHDWKLYRAVVPAEMEMNVPARRRPMLRCPWYGGPMIG